MVSAQPGAQGQRGSSFLRRPRLPAGGRRFGQAGRGPLCDVRLRETLWSEGVREERDETRGLAGRTQPMPWSGERCSLGEWPALPVERAVRTDRGPEFGQIF